LWCPSASYALYHGKSRLLFLVSFIIQNVCDTEKPGSRSSGRIQEGARETEQDSPPTKYRFWVCLSFSSYWK
jgi:hypothetical protein